MEKGKGSFIKANDGFKIFLRTWENVRDPKGIVQIFHGMAEHSGRYDDFANFLNSKKYIVYANDHRGHGLSLIENNVLGYVGKDGFNNIVMDEKIISDFIKEKYKDLPLYIFAHSFGSFIGQEYIIRYSKDIDGMILSGSAKQTGIELKAGRMLASVQYKYLDNKLPAKLLDKLSFSTYNSKVADKKTKFDWLTSDAKEVDKYINDSLSGYISPIDFYYNMFKGFKELYKRDRLAQIRKTLPILILSGDKDPVGKYGKSITKLYNLYYNLNIEKLTLKLYPNGRHELLNEINKIEVYNYVYNWIKTA
ncbi:MAG TPA: alpha/beta hydrolase [Eubacteriaceae bacterium]|jgi:alpha-beta hydrolase superfamily lysophospholipase|nr:alpha/beta hydrolase [Eubacteriaceae bacterium]